MPVNLDKGPIVVLGAVLVQVLAGTVYVWGTISVYICSYLQNNGAPDTTYESTFLVIPLSYLFTAVSGPIATGPLHFVSPRIITFIGCILITLSIYLCQFVRSSALVLLLYGVVAGIGEGFVFLILSSVRSTTTLIGKDSSQDSTTQASASVCSYSLSCFLSRQPSQQVS